MAAGQRQPEEFSGDCEIQTCDRPARAKGYCWMHYKRLQRGTALNARPQERLDPYARLLESVRDVNEAEDYGERELSLAIYRLKKSIERYFGSLWGKRGAAARWKKARRNCPQRDTGLPACPTGEQAQNSDAEAVQPAPQAGGRGKDTRRGRTDGSGAPLRGGDARPRAAGERDRDPLPAQVQPEPGAVHRVRESAHEAPGGEVGHRGGSGERRRGHEDLDPAHPVAHGADHDDQGHRPRRGGAAARADDARRDRPAAGPRRRHGP